MTDDFGDMELDLDADFTANFIDKPTIYKMVNQAIKDGVLIEPDVCSVCGWPGWPIKLVPHHNDYTKPLDIEWLCRSCHQVLHRILRPRRKGYKKKFSKIPRLR
jgi:hypothetical protein